jgi:hypothetical protein
VHPDGERSFAGQSGRDDLHFPQGKQGQQDNNLEMPGGKIASYFAGN